VVNRFRRTQKIIVREKKMSCDPEVNEKRAVKVEGGETKASPWDEEESKTRGRGDMVHTPLRAVRKKE